GPQRRTARAGTPAAKSAKIGKAKPFQPLIYADERRSRKFGLLALCFSITQLQITQLPNSSEFAAKLFLSSFRNRLKAPRSAAIVRRRRRIACADNVQPHEVG